MKHVLYDNCVHCIPITFLEFWIALSNEETVNGFCLGPVQFILGEKV